MATNSPSPNTAFKRKPIPAPPSAGHGISGKPLPVDKDNPCPHCGNTGAAHRHAQPKEAVWADKAQRRIVELEAEVRDLTSKASASAVRVADCEDEIIKLKKAAAEQKALPSPPPTKTSQSLTTVSEEPERTRSPSPNQEPIPAMPTPPPPQPPAPKPPATLGRSLTTTRITNFLTARRMASPISPADTAQSVDSVADLTSRLTIAENARKVAEEKLTRTNQELEELTASLFQTANDMVSKERQEAAAKAEERDRKADEREKQWTHWQREIEKREKASAQRTRALEKKVKRLEGRVQTLEAREKDRSIRLERLENAMRRTGRIRGMLDAHAANRP